MPKPFGKIALSLSGGATRAAGYHTGTLAFLDYIEYNNGSEDTTLLKDVATLSTVSGGTLTGLAYAADLKSERTFREFYFGLKTDLDGVKLFVRKLLELLNTRHAPGPAGRRYLSSAYADLLEEYFNSFKGREFSLFDNQSPSIHLEQMIFNSVETYFGDAYRFHHGTLGGGSGSSNVPLEAELAAKTRLADILAASSNLPGTFTPIEFPEDFHWPDDREPDPYNHLPRENMELVKASIHRQFQNNGGDTNTESIVLIDGGVYDNQGMSAIVDWLRSTDLTQSAAPFRRLFRFDIFDAAIPEEEPGIAQIRTLTSVGASRTTGRARLSFWNRLQLRPPPIEIEHAPPTHLLSTEADVSDDEYGLFFVSDCPALNNKKKAIYDIGKKEWKTVWGTKLWTVVLVAIAGTIFGLIASLYLVYRLFRGPPLLLNPSLWDLVFFIVAVGVLLLVAGLSAVLLWKFFRVLKSCKNAGGSVWPFIRRLRLRDLRNMGVLRGGSVAAVITKLMPNRIRDLGIEKLLLDPLINSDTVVVSEVDDLTKDVPDGLPTWLAPTDQMIDLAEEMSGMETRFWLEPEEFDNLVAVGQCTTCYNLLVQMVLREGLYPRNGDPEDPPNAGFANPLHGAIYVACSRAWREHLRDDPTSLVPEPEPA